MAQYWFFLSDPDSYHYDELFKKKREVWDGVHGSMAQKHIAGIRKGDRILERLLRAARPQRSVPEP
jgi:predicted RNA-binding protein with PUA-like domain